jgi:uncharacterized membrane protein YkvA (DUF1232 family)
MSTMETDEEIAREIREGSERDDAAPQSERNTRFYDRLRRSIQQYLDKKGGALGKTGEFLLLVPDVFTLLWRLTTDSRVTGKDKMLLGSAVAYYLFPFDIIPEALIGPMGFMDDLVFGVFVLNKILGADPHVVREHWSGSEDVLVTIQRVLGAADSLVGSDMVSKIKKMMG